MYTAVGQLECIIKDYPSVEYYVDIVGVIIDYIHKARTTLCAVLKSNVKIYESLFLSDDLTHAQRLIRSQILSPSDAEKLRYDCINIFPVANSLITQYLEFIEMESNLPYPGRKFIDNPSEYLGFNVETVIWQISDIHFGKYNKLDNDPLELAARIASAASSYKNISPDIVIISGDLTSVAADNEFHDFNTFCTKLSKCLWGDSYPERLLVVPGNHDIRWEDDGLSDRLRKFKSIVANSRNCITPFSEDQSIDGGNIVVKSINDSTDDVPPFVKISYFNRNLEIYLLVTGYYSGEVPLEVRDILSEEIDASVENLNNLLRTDKGAVNQQYLFMLNSEISEDLNALRIGVMHHNPIPYGTEPCENKYAPLLMETLRKKNINIIMHGHVHLTEDLSSNRPFLQTCSYPIPCPTLTSINLSGKKGINVHLIGNDNGLTAVSTSIWELSASSGFNEDGISVRYRLQINKDNVSVKHNK